MDLVSRIRAGDPDAETDLVRRYSRNLLLILRKRTRNAFLSDDLHQETFRIVLEKLRAGGMEDPGKLVRFLLRTAQNLMWSEYRRRCRHVDEEAAGEPVDPTPGQLARVVEDETARELRHVIAGLENDRDRAILLRFYVEEESKEAICADLGLSCLHFNRVLFRARERLKKALREKSLRR